MELLEIAVRSLLATVAFVLLWAIPELLKQKPWKRRKRSGTE
jgi:hypothetical protein